MTKQNLIKNFSANISAKMDMAKWFVTIADAVYKKYLKNQYDLELCETTDELNGYFHDYLHDWYDLFEYEHKCNTDYNDAPYLETLNAMDDIYTAAFGGWFYKYLCLKLGIEK